MRQLELLTITPQPATPELLSTVLPDPIVRPLCHRLVELMVKANEGSLVAIARRAPQSFYIRMFSRPTGATNHERMDLISYLGDEMTESHLDTTLRLIDHYGVTALEWYAIDNWFPGESRTSLSLNLKSNLERHRSFRGENVAGPNLTKWQATNFDAYTEKIVRVAKELGLYPTTD